MLQESLIERGMGVSSSWERRVGAGADEGLGTNDIFWGRNPKSNRRDIAGTSLRRYKGFVHAWIV